MESKPAQSGGTKTNSSIFGRGRLASMALPGQHEIQQMGRSWRGRETPRWEIKPPSPWQSTRKLRKLKWNCTTMAAASLQPQTHALKACPKPMEQREKTQGTRFSGPVASCFSQNLLGAVAHSQPSPLWPWKASSHEELCSDSDSDYPHKLPGDRENDPCTTDWLLAGQSCWFRGACFVLQLLEGIDVSEWLFLHLVILSAGFLSQDRLRSKLKAKLCWEWGGKIYRTGGAMRLYGSA